MASNYGKGKWQINGPRALAWLRAEVPKRQSIKGLPGECAVALRLPVDGQRLTDWLGEGGRAEWTEIKRTLGKGTRTLVAGERVAVPPVPTRTLAEFLRDKRREGCPVCALSPDILQCLAEAANKGTAKVPEQVEWLNTDCGAHVTVQELTAHRAGRHEG